MFAQRVLAGQRSEPSGAPPSSRELRERARKQEAGIGHRGYRVHGDLEELVPAPGDGEGRDPDEVAPDARATRPSPPSPPCSRPGAVPGTEGRGGRPGVPRAAIARDPAQVAMAAAPVQEGNMSPKIFLHVGSPKTGTTFLQNVLWKQRSLAREQGLLLPQDRFPDHYLASLDVRGSAGRPHHPPQAVGMWHRMVESHGVRRPS